MRSNPFAGSDACSAAIVRHFNRTTEKECWRADFIGDSDSACHQNFKAARDKINFGLQQCMLAIMPKVRAMVHAMDCQLDK